MSKVRENLIAARALIDTPEKWGKGGYVSATPNVCFCAVGALANANCWSFAEVWHERAIDVLYDKLPPNSGGLTVYNDHPDTTHADIMALFDRAIAAAEQVAA